MRTDSNRFFKIVLRTLPDRTTRVMVNGHVVYVGPTPDARGSQPIRVHMLGYALEKMGCVATVHHRYGDAPPEVDA